MTLNVPSPRLARILAGLDACAELKSGAPLQALAVGPLADLHAGASASTAAV